MASQGWTRWSTTSLYRAGRLDFVFVDDVVVAFVVVLFDLLFSFWMIAFVFSLILFFVNWIVLFASDDVDQCCPVRLLRRRGGPRIALLSKS